MHEVVRRFGDSPGRRRARTLGVLAVLLLGWAAPSLEALAAAADDGCCSGVCEDGCCFLSEKARQRLHQEQRERARSRSREPGFEAQSACPDDCSALPAATLLPAASVAPSNPSPAATSPEIAASGPDACVAVSVSWRPDAPRGPPISVVC